MNFSGSQQYFGLQDIPYRPPKTQNQEKQGPTSHQSESFCSNDKHSQEPVQTFPNQRDRLMSELRKEYQPKILENCQRTVRVILISELDKLVNTSKKARVQLNEILGDFVPTKKHVYSDDQFERNERGSYYHSLNYSRVKIGQKIFEKRILTNPHFRELFLTIFDNQNLSNSDKPRKNERSRISFEERKKILTKIIQFNKKIFLKSFKVYPQTQDSSIGTSEQPLVAPEKEKEENNSNSDIILPETTPLQFPIFVIPLRPLEYNQYMKEKGLL